MTKIDYIDFKNPEDDLWFEMCQCGLGKPISIREAKSSKCWDSFIYDRRYGVFPCQPCDHSLGMSLLYALHLGYEDAIDALGDSNLCDVEEMAEEYLKTSEGTAYKSSVSDSLVTYNKDSLNATEKRVFPYEISYISEAYST